MNCKNGGVLELLCPDMEISAYLQDREMSMFFFLIDLCLVSTFGVITFGVCQLSCLYNSFYSHSVC